MPELHHYSEDPSVTRFEPRAGAAGAPDESLVWAVDAEHAYLYLFPRDCPRVTFYISQRTSAADVERFFSFTTARRVAAIEASWLPVLRSTSLYRYAFDAEGFELRDATAGYWVSRRAVRPLAVEPVGDLLDALLREDVELRLTPSLRPLRDAVIASTLEFSIIRWRNAAPPNVLTPAG